ALLGAVIGGLIIPRLERRLAAVSSWYRAQAAARLTDREHAIAALSANPQLLAVAYLDALVAVVALTAMIACFVTVEYLIHGAPLLDGVAVPPSSLSESWTGTLLLITLTIVLIIAGYYVGRRITTVQTAW